tara:strand:- start:225 stop:1436 length:1212 start_codon:yes stop_codon:yes gene_type:complete
MASTYVNDLRLNEMATGDQSGAWGAVTNLNLEMIAEAFAYGTEAIANASTHTVTIPDGAKGDERRFYLKCTGGGQACTVTLAPNTVSKVWMIENATSYTLTFTQGSGANVAVLAGQVKMIATDGAGSGAVIYDLLTDVNLAGTTHLDAVDIDGAVQLDATLTVGANDQGYDVILYGDTASANMTWDTSADDLIFNGAAGLIVPDGQLTLGSTAVTSTATELNQLDGKVAKTAGLETIWIPAAAMYPSTTNPCSDLTQVETTALRPDMKVLDFAADADDFAQFAISFPKSWNEGVIKFQVFWTPSTTNTGNCIWGLQGVSVADGATIDVAFGTAVTVTDAGIGTVEDQQVSAVSGDVTLTNAAVDTQSYFQIFRDANAGGDTFTGVSRLLGIKLFFTTDAANDA